MKHRARSVSPRNNQSLASNDGTELKESTHKYVVLPILPAAHTVLSMKHPKVCLHAFHAAVLTHYSHEDFSFFSWHLVLFLFPDSKLAYKQTSPFENDSTTTAELAATIYKTREH